MIVTDSTQQLTDFYNEIPNKSPNLFLIGAMRSGSTTLHKLLTQHPAIFMSEIKEPMFFVSEALRKRTLKKTGLDLADAENQLSEFMDGGRFREVAKYKKLFATAGGYTWRGESSHYLYHPDTATAIHQHAPQARIIISLRNPVDRLYSEYMFYRRTKREQRSFSDFVWQGCEFDASGNFLSAPVGNKLNKGFYSELIRPWLDLFGESQVKIIQFDELIREPTEVCRSIFTWLGLDCDFQPKTVHAERSGVPRSELIGEWLQKGGLIRKTFKRILPKHVRTKLRGMAYRFFLDTKDMNIDLRRDLVRVYQNDVESLEMLIKLDLSKWKL